MCYFKNRIHKLNIKPTELYCKDGKRMQPNEKALYIIDEFPYGKDVLCLHVTDTFENGYLCFDDTERGHMIQGIIREKHLNGFEFEDRSGNVWIFREVTIQEFRHHISKTVYNGEAIAKLCTTTEDLWEYYRKKFPINN